MTHQVTTLITNRDAHEQQVIWREFWQKVYIAAVRNGSMPSWASDRADEALKTFIEVFYTKVGGYVEP